MDTLEVHINLNPKSPWDEILVAELADLGFDSFVHHEEGIAAYGNADLDVDHLLRQTSLYDGFDGEFSIETKRIPQQNWNAKWESDFQPVHVESYASIVAPFHDTKEAEGLIVTIQPKMSFGTGHHQTTWMMTKALFELDEIPEIVLDMGTGTGVLAVVAEKLGAKEVVAVDIEDWSVENTIENAKSNQCERITAICGDIDVVPQKTFGLILANINKNVLKTHMPHYARMLEENGVLLLSGFFQTDVNEMESTCSKYGLILEKGYEKDEWAAIQLRKKH